MPALVPNRRARIVLCDDGDGVAERAARRAEALGYRHVHVLAGGAPAGSAPATRLFAGVNVPSKTFGELVEHRRHTPRITAQQLRAMLAAGDNLVIVDGRPFAEYRRMNIPGGMCCPNGELALRIEAIAPDPETTIVVNCAGRTRSIIGAQTLIDFGVPNPVLALENGTQGWFLAGLTLERGASRIYPDRHRPRRRRAAARPRSRGSHGAAVVSADEAHGWLADPARTTYLLDVRTAEEFAASGVPGFVHAPGGQLIQATDQWVGVKGARLVLLDAEEVRAPVVAAWLRQLGHEAFVLDGGRPPPRLRLAAACGRPARAALQHPPARLTAHGRQPCRSSTCGPAPTFARPPRRCALVDPPAHRGSVCDGAAKPVVLIADEAGVAALAALDLAEAGCGTSACWRVACGAGAPPGCRSRPHRTCRPTPTRIDFLFFTARPARGRRRGRAPLPRPGRPA